MNARSRVANPRYEAPMAAERQRTPLAQAQAIADGLIDLLRPATRRIEVAGSIRRGRADIGDIELVAIPKVHTEMVPRLFEDEERVIDELEQRIDALLIQGTLLPHPTDPKRGDRYAKLLHAKSGMQIDLFKAREHTWGIIHLVRTGPALYSRGFVTAAHDRGYHVAGGELHEGRMGCSATPCTVVPTPEEADVYRVMRVAYIAPEARR